MRALQFAEYGGPEVLRVVDVDEPHAGPGQVRVRVRAVGVNPVDWKARSGMFAGPLPRTTGIEAAGVVDEVGAGVAAATGIAVGDAVFGSTVGGLLFDDSGHQATFAFSAGLLMIAAALVFATSRAGRLRAA